MKKTFRALLAVIGCSLMLSCGHRKTLEVDHITVVPLDGRSVVEIRDPRTIAKVVQCLDTKRPELAKFMIEYQLELHSPGGRSIKIAVGHGYIKLEDGTSCRLDCDLTSLLNTEGR